MLCMFDELKDVLPPFNEYYKHLYEKKTIKTISETSVKNFPFAILREELFSTSSETNIKLNETTVTLGSVSARAILREIRDLKKLLLIIYQQRMVSSVGRIHRMGITKQDLVKLL